MSLNAHGMGWSNKHGFKVNTDPVIFNSSATAVSCGWTALIDPGFALNHALKPNGAPRLPDMLPARGQDALNIRFLALTIKMAGLNASGLPSWTPDNGSVGADAHTQLHFPEDPGLYSRLARTLARQIIGLTSQFSPGMAPEVKGRLEPLFTAAIKLANEVLVHLNVEADREKTYRELPGLLLSLRMLVAFYLNDFSRELKEAQPDPRKVEAVALLTQIEQRFRMRLSYPTTDPNSYGLKLVWDWADLATPQGVAADSPEGDLMPAGEARASDSVGPAAVMCSFRLGRSYTWTSGSRGKNQKPAIYLLARPLTATAFARYGTACFPDRPDADCELRVDATKAVGGTLSVR